MIDYKKNSKFKEAIVDHYRTVKKIVNYFKNKIFINDLILATLPAILFAVPFYTNNLHIIHWDRSVPYFLSLLSISFFIGILVVKRWTFLQFIPLGFAVSFYFLILFSSIDYKNILIYALTPLFAIGIYIVKKYIKVIYIFFSFLLISQFIQGFLNYKDQSKDSNFSFDVKN